jgi:hypothetical protein
MTQTKVKEKRSNVRHLRRARSNSEWNQQRAHQQALGTGPMLADC